jgi:hypothetical protein
MEHADTSSPPASETTELERRVLAHERILQALIAYMARREPRFVIHLKKLFVEPMDMTRHEQDYRETDDYADAFIRAVIRMGETPVPPAADPETDVGQMESSGDGGATGPVMGRHISEDRVQVRERSGVWEVRVDGEFRGDYHQEDHAIAAAAGFRSSL